MIILDKLQILTSVPVGQAVDGLRLHVSADVLRLHRVPQVHSTQ